MNEKVKKTLIILTPITIILFFYLFFFYIIFPIQEIQEYEESNNIEFTFDRKIPRFSEYHLWMRGTFVNNDYWANGESQSGEVSIELKRDAPFERFKIFMFHGDDFIFRPISSKTSPSSNEEAILHRAGRKEDPCIILRSTKEIYKCFVIDYEWNEGGKLEVITTDMLNHHRNGITYKEVNDNVHIIIVNPKRESISLTAIPGLSHELYLKKGDTYLKDYKGKRFNELVDDARKVNPKKVLIATVNASFIDKEGRPLGFVISNSIDYSYDEVWLKKQYSLAISKEGKSDIIKGRDEEPNLYHNVVSGFGRFVHEGKYIDLCNGTDEDKEKDQSALGNYSCNQALARSAVGITESGLLIFLVSNQEASLHIIDVYNNLQEVANQEGTQINKALLFDGGISPSLYVAGYDDLPVGTGEIGSVLGVYYEDVE